MRVVREEEEEDVDSPRSEFDYCRPSVVRDEQTDLSRPIAKICGEIQAAQTQIRI